MMSQSVTLVTGLRELPETWKRYYNGPNVGLIDEQIAALEMPWLIGRGGGVTLDTSRQGSLMLSADGSAQVADTEN